MSTNAQKEAELKIRGTIVMFSIAFESNLMSIVYASNVEQYRPPYHKRLKLKGCTFEQKIKRTREVLEIYHSDLLSKYESLFLVLDKFREFRNLFAHCGIDWCENPKNEFDVWDWTESDDGFQHYTPIRFILEDVTGRAVDYSKEITPSLTELRNEIELRLKDAHPQIYEILTLGDKPHEAS
jgi:hypothetical protein